MIHIIQSPTANSTISIGSEKRAKTQKQQQNTSKI